MQNSFKLGFNLPSIATQVQGALDRDLSRINHRLYRQSRNYVMKVDIDSNLPAGSVIDVYALQDTWMAQKAYKLAYEIFLETSKEEMEIMTTQGRWYDFRVANGLTFDPTSSESYPTLYDLPDASSLAVYSGTIDYNYTEVADATGTANTFRWSGTGTNTFNIIDEYDRTGNTDSTPSNPSNEVAYDGLTDEVDDSQVSHLASDGDIPPYNRNVIENSVWVHVGQLHVDPSGARARLSTGYFTAPCGIYVLAMSGGLTGTSANGKITVTAKGGDYKGVHATSMLE